MAGFKDPDFNQRRDAAQKARESALAKLKARPQLDEAEVARRQAERAAREAAQAEKRRAAKEAREQAAEEARRAKAEAAAAAEAEAAANKPPQKTEEELKAARDARYAARKARKKR
jgi:hypothetical protein